MLRFYWTPVAQGPHSHILMTGGSDRGSYFIPKKIPQCFCISKFYYLSSGKLKYANFNFGFGQKQNYKLRLCYCWFELMKNTIPKKIPVLFSRFKKIPASFIDPKKIPFGKNLRPKKILRTRPSLKYVSGAPGTSCSIQGACFLSSNDSRSTMKQDCFSLCLTTAYLFQLATADSLDTVKISKRFACANELSKWHFGKLE